MKYNLLLIVVLLITACDKNDSESKNIILSDDYFPLEIGNYWQFDSSGKIKVAGTKTIESKSYFMLVTATDTSYYRKENNKIYGCEYGEKAGVKFDLSANVNETWNYGSYTVKLVSKSDTVVINGQKIIGCYQFYFDIPEAFDDEHSIWLAKGIGLIQNYCGLCYESYAQLDKALIGGQVVNF